MPRSRVMEGLIPGSCKIRKRGCSSSSSSSAGLQNCRFKRAILVRKARGSRSSTPVPTWRTTASVAALRSAAESPKYAPSQGGGGRSRPVSARKLAATLWEMNGVPSPKVREDLEEKRLLKKELKARERMRSSRSVHSGSLPPHLSDPSHSPVSERMDRSGTRSRHGRISSMSSRLRLTDINVGVLDSVSSASLMEIETRSRGQTPSRPVVGGRTRLKDVSNALTTSKELLKIINRIWAQDDQPSSMSLISALHAELERARLQVNQLIQEERSDQNDINYLIKCFAEEKAAWKSKEQQVVETAIESVATELEVERKLRRRLESLNKKLGKELAETKALLMKSVKELESERRAKEIMEQVCDDLTRDISDGSSKVEELNRDSSKIHEGVAENEREMLHLADILHKDKVHKKATEAKHQFEEKTSAVDKLRNQLESFMRTRSKDKGCSSLSHGNTGDISAYLSRSHFGSCRNEIKEEDGEVEDGDDCEEGSDESDLHSVELNMNNNKSYKWTNSLGAAPDSRRISLDDEIKGRSSTSGRPPRRSTSLLRSISDGVEWGDQSESIQSIAEGLDCEGIYSSQSRRKGYGETLQGYKSAKGLREQILSTSRLGSMRDFASPTREWGHTRPSRDPASTVQDRLARVQTTGLNSRLAETRGEIQTARRSKR